MRVFPQRGPITDVFLGHLRTTLEPVLVGDGIKPDGAGWQGEANASDYAEYVVLTTADAAPRNTATIAEAHKSWVMNYSIDFYGVARAQADDLADRARLAALSFAKHEIVIGERKWKVTDVRYGRLGAIRPNYSQDPALWGGQDIAQLWLDAMKTPAVAG